MIPSLLFSASNFRDLGGLPCGNGRRLRKGLLFRSGIPDPMHRAPSVRLDKLGIRLVCDLRSEGERLRHPAVWPSEATPKQMHFHINADIRAQNPGINDILRLYPGNDGAQALMRKMWCSLPQACMDVLRQIGNTLADDNALPMLIHCTAGKDRTGFVIAVLLTALDVPLPAIREDYLRTRGQLDLERLDEAMVPVIGKAIGRPPSAEELAVINGVDAAWLDAAFAHIDTMSGSLDAYLHDVGLSQAQRWRLAERLTQLA